VSKKIVLVTGASRGIGRAAANKLSKTGFNVIGTATSQKGVDQINQEGMYGLILNLNDKKSIESMWENIIDNFNCVDILINNAGITKDNIIARMSMDEWEEVINIHLNATFYMCQRATKLMMKNRFGRVINISSTSATIGNRGQGNYAAAKAGIEAFTRTLAREFGSRGITANNIAPGFIDTDMTKFLSEEERDNIQKDIPLNRFGKPEEVADLINFLASDEASYITGQTIHLNGGLYM
jgi:3-oxoacyl-[acyl-carrier protein] reductase|tara:strand:+ start:151 stop:867 length:717 start_codon:yes stop_codon:yes gene_type:complete